MKWFIKLYFFVFVQLHRFLAFPFFNYMSNWIVLLYLGRVVQSPIKLTQD